MTENISTKSRLACLLLAWFLGPLGIHRMYVGKVGSGIVMLLISITFYGLIISAIWALVDLVTIIVGSFRDADNLKVKNWLD